MLGCLGTLTGHKGCVNRTVWSADGSKFASVSDDTDLVLWGLCAEPEDRPAVVGWEPPRRPGRPSASASAPAAFGLRMLQRISTGHGGNVFGVAFLPHAGDKVLVTGAMDGEVRVHSTAAPVARGAHAFSPTPTAERSPRAMRLERRFGARASPPSARFYSELRHTHRTCVKNVDVAPDCAHLAWSASEDGTVAQIDVREAPAQARPVLITSHAARASGGASRASLRHVAVNPVRPHLLAVAVDSALRVYDRRMLPGLGRAIGGDRCTGLLPSAWSHASLSAATRNVLSFTPLHLSEGSSSSYRRSYATMCEWDASGDHLLGTYSGDGIYVFNATAVELRAPVETYGPSRCEHSGEGRERRGGTWEEGVDVTRGGEAPIRPAASAPPVLPPVLPAPGPRGGLRSAYASSFAHPSPALSASAKDLKERGDSAFKKGEFGPAVAWYSGAIEAVDRQRIRAARSGEDTRPASSNASGVATLYSNRAAALAKRGAAGDAAGSVHDFALAAACAPHSWRIQLKLCNALTAAGCQELARAHASAFVHNWSRVGDSESEGEGEALDLGINEAKVIARQQQERRGDAAGRPSSVSDDEEGEGRLTMEGEDDPWLARDRRRQPEGEEDEEEEEEGEEEDEEGKEEEEEDEEEDEESEGTESSGRIEGEGSPPPTEAEGGPLGPSTLQPPPESAWLTTLGPPILSCTRHVERYTGHENAATDIKEAAFWAPQTRAGSGKDVMDVVVEDGEGMEGAARLATGRRGYILSGSDDGRLWVYDRATGMPVGAYGADGDVLNCVRPHPILPLIATSGIDSVIRLWAPRSLGAGGEPLEEGEAVDASASRKDLRDDRPTSLAARDRTALAGLLALTDNTGPTSARGRIGGRAGLQGLLAMLQPGVVQEEGGGEGGVRVQCPTQ
jgi:WD40 repeat protein